MTGNRTTSKWIRQYMGGYDVSGYSRSVGPLSWVFDEVGSLTTLADDVKGYLPGQCEITPTVLNGVLDHTTNGLHDIAKGAGVSWAATTAIGMNALPAQGDWAFCGYFQQSDYKAQDDGGGVVVTVPFAGQDVANRINYPQPWGRILHAKGAETAANTAAGVDWGAASVLGGYMVYHVFAGNGTATLKVQKSTTTNTNAAFSDLSGATSGSIDCSTPKSGIIQLGTTDSVGQYLRWQIALGTATTVTFALVFCRGIH